MFTLIRGIFGYVPERAERMSSSEDAASPLSGQRLERAGGVSTRRFAGRYETEDFMRQMTYGGRVTSAVLLLFLLFILTACGGTPSDGPGARSPPSSGRPSSW